MRHGHKNKIPNFGRDAAHRKAILRNLAESLIRYGEIETTLAKAKALRSFIERLIVRAKKGDLASRRYVFRFIRQKDVFWKLMRLAPKYKRNSGFVSFVRVKYRKGDGAVIARVRLISPEEDAENLEREA